MPAQGAPARPQPTSAASRDVLDESCKNDRLDRSGRRWRWDPVFRAWCGSDPSGEELWYGTVADVDSLFSPLTFPTP